MPTGRLSRRMRLLRTGTLLAILLLAAGAGWRIASSAAASNPASPASTSSSTSVPGSTSTTSTTTTTSPVSALPQTRTLPPRITPSLTRRMRALLRAVGSGDYRLALPAFFPVEAYVQTKIYWDAAHDWRTRLIPEFAADIRNLHRRLDPSGAPMRLLGYAVDDAAAVWVLPGEEFNKGPYWRVYYTVVAFGIGSGSARSSLTVNTMISWRGAWYIAHVANFNG